MQYCFAGKKVIILKVLLCSSCEQRHLHRILIDNNQTPTQYCAMIKHFGVIVLFEFSCGVDHESRVF